MASPSCPPPFAHKAHSSWFVSSGPADMATENNDEFDKMLKREDLEFIKDEEITRILRAFKLDAYAILDLVPGCTTKDIRNVFRKKSLLIHPDKTTNPKAPGEDTIVATVFERYTDNVIEAFDKLKKAEGELMDDKTRELIDSAIATARRLLINERKWTVDSPELQMPEFMQDWRAKTREVLIEDELNRRRKRALQMAEEGRVRQEEEARDIERKRKKDSEKHWEDTREERVRNWRNFIGHKSEGDVPPPPSKKVKKSKKPRLLG